MAFLSDLDKKISMLGQGAVQKTKDMTDTAKMAAAIRGLDAQRKEAFEQLGQFYYDSYEKYGGDLTDTENELISRIENIEAQKKQLQEQMQKIKGTIFCPNCHTEIPKNSQFCNICGTKIEHLQPEPIVQYSAKKCVRCGSPLDEDQLFCTNCGAKVEESSDFAPAASETNLNEMGHEKIFCPNCGKELKPEQKFCTSCGAKVRL